MTALRTFRRGYRTLRSAGVGGAASIIAAFRVAFGPAPGEEDWPGELQWEEKRRI